MKLRSSGSYAHHESIACSTRANFSATTHEGCRLASADRADRGSRCRPAAVFPHLHPFDIAANRRAIGIRVRSSPSGARITSTCRRPGPHLVVDGPHGPIADAIPNPDHTSQKLGSNTTCLSSAKYAPYSSQPGTLLPPRRNRHCARRSPPSRRASPPPPIPTTPPPVYSPTLSICAFRMALAAIASVSRARRLCPQE